MAARRLDTRRTESIMCRPEEGRDVSSAASSVASVESSAFAAGGTALHAPTDCSSRFACCAACAPAAASVPGACGPSARRAAARARSAHRAPSGPSGRTDTGARLDRKVARVAVRRGAQRVRRAPQRRLHRRQRNRQHALAPLGVLLGERRVGLHAAGRSVTVACSGRLQQQQHDAGASGRARAPPARTRGAGAPAATRAN